MVNTPTTRCTQTTDMFPVDYKKTYDNYMSNDGKSPLFAPHKCWGCGSNLVEKFKNNPASVSCTGCLTCNRSFVE